MALENPMHDKAIAEIRRIEGLLAYAVEHGDTAEIQRLKVMLDQLLEKQVG